MKVSLFLSLLLTSVLMQSCATTNQGSNIVGAEFNEETNITDYFVLPLGSAKIPGNWKKVEYNSISHQQFFVNIDSISLAIAFTECDNFEFNVNGAKKNYDFVRAFYEWDTDYFRDRFGFDNEVIEENREQKFIVYRLFGRTREENYDNYFLIGEKNGNVSNFSISITDKWSDEQKIDFLKKLFLSE